MNMMKSSEPKTWNICEIVGGARVEKRPLSVEAGTDCVVTETKRKMPLPAALAARLAKRGIIQPKENKKEEVEEVFAEDYDDHMDDNPAPESKSEKEEEIPKDLVHEAPACPNLTNPFHECSEYCQETFGFKKFNPIESLEKSRNKMLLKYPLPVDWLEVGDPETGRHYYWQVTTDQVSWLPPQHPRSEITLPAEKLKEALEGKLKAQALEKMDEDDDHDFEELERELMNEKRKKEKRGRRGRERDDDALDPMDPAAYSDIPRGTWSTGLEIQGSAKTGADTTASGPLFQQRPYPSPGAVLRANQGMD